MVIPFYGHRRTRWDPDQELGGSWPFLCSNVNTSDRSEKHRATALLALGKACCRGHVLVRASLTSFHRAVVCFEVRVLQPRGAEVPLSGQWAGHDLFGQT